MGYYTRFELETNRAESDPVELDRFYEDANNGVTFGEYEMSLLLTDETMKWYGYEKDMKELSEAYPNVLFVLSGEGEESGDIWRAYFMNGQVEHVAAKIVFPEPDISKFKRVDLTEKRAKELAEAKAAREAELLAKEKALADELRRVKEEIDNLA